MGYRFDVDVATLLEGRTAQLEHLGVPAEDVAHVRGAVSQMWRNEPGGWVYEWSDVAGRHSRRGEPHLAALAYGCAAYPGPTDPGRRWAYARQLQEYEADVSTLRLRFERKVVSLPEPVTGAWELPVHVYSHVADRGEAPVVILSGGLDTWKIELHPWCLALADAGLTVVAFDLPGTGEAPLTLGPSADPLVTALVLAARSWGDGRVAHVGTSFGGNFSAMTGLRSLVDAAVVLGGPVVHTFALEHLRRLPHGMADVLGNAIGYRNPPTAVQVAVSVGTLSRARLLHGTTNAPMLVVNGADDPVVPACDALAFHGRPETEVHLLAGSGHCALGRMDVVQPMIIDWLLDRFSRSGPSAPAGREG
jgi:esterase FrsA